MKSKHILYLALVLSLVLAGCATAPSASSGASRPPATNKDLTSQISAVLTEMQNIKPGMTRAELLEVFTTEGGLSTAAWRTFVYRDCRYIKVDVEFTLSDPDQKVIEERSTDIISKISKPYLGWSSQ